MGLTHETFLPGSDVMVWVTFDYTPYDPGRISGPPELCYPPEGGDAEISEVVVMNGAEEIGDVLEFLNESTLFRLQNVCEVWAREAQSAGEL